MSPQATIVVVGAGVFGVASALELARRGHRVTLYDRGRLPAADAASVDLSRAVRMDYGADRFYAELARESIEGWRCWNRRWNETVYHEVGFLLMTASAMQPGQFEADGYALLTEMGYPLTRLDDERIRRDFPLWRDAGFVDGYYNPNAGWAASGRAVEHLLVEAREAGVDVVEQTRVVEVGDRGVRLAAGEQVRADTVVLACGAWTTELLPAMRGRVRPSAQPVVYLRPTDPEPFGGRGFPVWGGDISRTGWYGFPLQADGTVKLGHHGVGKSCEPDARGRLDEATLARFRQFVDASLPGLRDAEWVDSKYCMYTDSVDGDFWVDRVPGSDSLVVATGGSGHGFKFAPVIGRLVADVVDEQPRTDGGRLAWRDAQTRRTEQARHGGDLLD